jgi:hypothetical protein
MPVEHPGVVGNGATSVGFIGVPAVPENLGERISRCANLNYATISRKRRTILKAGS